MQVAQMYQVITIKLTLTISLRERAFLICEISTKFPRRAQQTWVPHRRVRDFRDHSTMIHDIQPLNASHALHLP